MALTASSSSSTIPSSCKYDVFMSFRGEETRNNFTSHLYAALCREKILAFIDSENLKSGEQISTLFKIIEETRLSTVIFSKNYAYSRWCLDELVCIMKCNNEKQHIVLPVFYGIDPSDVRNQNGNYADAFVKHEKRFTEDKMNEWRKALRDAANLCGFDSQKGFVPESQLVDKIVKAILEKLYSISKIRSDAFTGLVGMEKRFKKIESSLCVGSQDVRIIGIWGMGGIGKTTLAQAVYNKICSQFEGCFSATFRGESNEVELHHFENILISTLLKDDNLDHLHSCFANDRLRRNMVLIFLDNVNQPKQLECLYGFGVSQQNNDRFGVGSRIILTSRDRKLLEDARADVIYEVEALDFDEALKLFCRKAFGGDSPMTDFVKLSEKVVRYARGNPLALDVLGSHLRSRPVDEWKSALEKLEKTPNESIDKVLKISYDALDDETKAIFLDIALFFQYKDRDFVEAILGVESRIGISMLVEKSLITINNFMIEIHDLLGEMASKIVKGQSTKVARRSRLNNAQDIYYVLKNNKGTKKIEGILLDLNTIPKGLCLSSTVFKDMCNLRFLIIKDGESINFPEGLGYLPDSLRYLKWDGFPLNSLPLNFNAHNLVILEMRGSRLKELWDGVQHLWNLKDIDLSYSQELIKLPDLSKAPKLENILLACCSSLRGLPNISASLKYLELSFSGIEALPSSFGSLVNIVSLNLNHCDSLKILPELPTNIEKLDLRWCKSLEGLPSNIWKLKSLQELDLSNCRSLKRLPEVSEAVEHLHYLSLKGTWIKELPSSIGNIIGLRNLDLSHCEDLMFLPECLKNLSSLLILRLVGCSKPGCFPSMLHGLNLTELKLGYCNIKEIPDWLGSLSSLNYLDLRGNNFETIPSSIEQLDKLQCLRIRDCKMLRHLPELPFSILRIDASECTLLEKVDCAKAFKGLPSGPGSINRHGYFFAFPFYNCCEMDQSSRHNLLAYFIHRVYNQAFSSKFDPTSSTCYPGNEIPDWFSTKWEGSTKTIELPQNLHNYNLLGFAICVALEFHGSFTISKWDYHILDLSFKTNDGENEYVLNGRQLIFEFDYYDTEITIGSDHLLMWYQYDLNIQRYLMNLDEVEASIKIIYAYEEIVKVKRCGLRLIYGQEALEECPSDGSRLFSVERPAGLGSSLPSVKPAPRPNHSNLFTPSNLPVGGDSENNLSEEDKKRLEKFQQLRVKYLRLLNRVGGSTEDTIARQVLDRLELVLGRQTSQAFSLENAKATALQLEAEGKDDLNFSLNILVLGKTGVGKSATINSIFGEKKTPVHAFGPSTTTVKDIVGTVDGVKIRVFDTPGLKSDAMEQSANRKILSSVKNVTKKCPLDIVLYVDKLDTRSIDLNDFPMLRSITTALGPSIWQSAILTLTHAASSPPDGPSGTPLDYEFFVAQRSQIVQQTIRQAVGDLRIMSPSLMNPISLVENHPSCTMNKDGQRVLPNGQAWRTQLLLLSYSMKILSEASNLSKMQESFDHK